jgi:hypothetical protein
MPGKSVPVSGLKQRFLEDYPLNDYSIIELVEWFSLSWKTANKWIARFNAYS